LGRAGHILGSAFIRFQDHNSGSSVLFSGDLGAADTPILVDPDPPQTADLVVMESTYGDRLHEPRDQRVRQLGDILTRALADGGKVFIPAFSLGRTQELIYEMDRIFSDPSVGRCFRDCKVNSARRFSSIRPWDWKSPGSMPACRNTGTTRPVG
jgi:metallo-beta-lactamase family protein